MFFFILSESRMITTCNWSHLTTFIFKNKHMLYNNTWSKSIAINYGVEFAHNLFQTTHARVIHYISNWCCIVSWYKVFIIHLIWLKSCRHTPRYMVSYLTTYSLWSAMHELSLLLNYQVFRWKGTSLFLALRAITSVQKWNVLGLQHN